MITRFVFKGQRRIFRFDYIGKEWAFVVFVVLVVVALWRLLS